MVRFLFELITRAYFENSAKVCVSMCASVCSDTFVSSRRIQCKLERRKAFFFLWYQHLARFEVLCPNVFFFSLLKSESECLTSAWYAKHGFCNKLDCCVNTSKWLISDLLHTCLEKPKTYNFHLLPNMMKDESWRSQIAGDMQLLIRTAEQQMPYERWWKMK